MQSVLFQSAQRIIKAVLDWLESSKISAITERTTDVFSDGVFQGALNNLEIKGKDFDPTLTDFFHIEVVPGVAYKNGERLLIPSPLVTFNASHISDTTDDGLGNPVSTPHSTGSFDIPLTSGFINYVYAKYLLATDEAKFTLHKITKAKQFYKQVDGYQIVTNTTGANPDPTAYIFLGQIDLTGSNTAITSTISIVNRDLSKTLNRRVGIETNSIGLTDRPASYHIGNQSLFLDDHIKAVGNGTISPTNPHALSLTDLGISISDTVQAHRQLEHGNGIISPSDEPLTSGLNCQVFMTNPGSDYIVVKALTGQEFAIVNGVAYGSSVIGVDVSVLFSVSDSSATYSIYFDSSTQTIQKTSVAWVEDETKLRLCSVVWTYVGSGPFDHNTLTALTDRRRFGTIQQVSRWRTAGQPLSPHKGTFGFNLDANKVEYWNGTSWVQLP